MHPIESSSAVFEALKTTLTTKGMRSLNNIKMACDLIVSAQGNMNFSRVGDVATNQFGGPKKQSIQNNNDLKRYITARINEYYGSQERLRKTDGATNDRNTEWPEDMLSARTKMYITQLRNRLDMVEKRYHELRKRQEIQSKIHPVSFLDTIEHGYQGTRTNTLNIQEETTALLKASLKSLLNIDKYVNSLQIETSHSRTGLVLKRPSGDVVILSPSQFECVMAFLKE